MLKLLGKCLLLIGPIFLKQISTLKKEKWPDQISQLGPQMAENLLQEEKKLQSQFPPEEQSCLNECRRILIAEVRWK